MRAHGGQSQPIQFVLSRGELLKIDLRIGELFPEGAWLNVVKYEGNLSYLNEDLMISEAAFNSAGNSSQAVLVGLPFTVVGVSFLLGAAAVLLGIVIGALVARLCSKK